MTKGTCHFSVKTTKKINTQKTKELVQLIKIKKVIIRNYKKLISLTFIFFLPVGGK